MLIMLVTLGTELELEIIFPEIQIPMPPPIYTYLAPLYKKQKNSLICSILVVVGVKVAKAIKIVSRLFSVRLWHIVVQVGC